MPECDLVQYQWVAWLFTALAFLAFVAWCVGLRKKLLPYLDNMDEVINGMVEFGESEGSKEYALRLLNMTPAELEREIDNCRIINRWGREIAKNLSGLRASIPFLGRS